MISVYDRDTRRFRDAMEHLPVSGWIDVDDPGEEERLRLAELEIPLELVAHALDDNELPRTLRRGEATLIVVRSSRPAVSGSRMPFFCPPLGIVLVHEYVVTIGRGNGGLLARAAERCPPESGANGLILTILAVVAEQFLVHLAEIERRVEDLEEGLQESLENAEIVSLLRLQRSLSVFATSLEMNEGALAMVRDTLFADAKHDQAALEDALTELRQARQLASTSSNLLGQLMDAFASIISNNINDVAKLLSALAVIVVVSSLVATFYGMNVRLPFADQPWTFWAIVLLSTFLSAIPAIWFRRRRWL